MNKLDWYSCYFKDLQAQEAGNHRNYIQKRKKLEKKAGRVPLTLA